MVLVGVLLLAWVCGTMDFICVSWPLGICFVFVVLRLWFVGLNLDLCYCFDSYVLGFVGLGRRMWLGCYGFGFEVKVVCLVACLLETFEVLFYVGVLALL